VKAGVFLISNELTIGKDTDIIGKISYWNSDLRCGYEKN
jgi:hypothetical protein